MPLPSPANGLAVIARTTITSLKDHGTMILEVEPTLRPQAHQPLETRAD
jgi:hypothetical protein